MTTQEAKSTILNSNQMEVLIDLPGMLELKQKAFEDFTQVNDQLVSKIFEQYGIENFNINSSAKKKELLAKLGIDTSQGAGKQIFEAFLDTYPILNELNEVSEKEHLRRCLWGAKPKSKKDVPATIFDDFYEKDGKIWFNPERVMTDGRLYQNKLYAMPYPMRTHCLPPVGTKFFYFDLHAAELTLSAHLSGDQQLLEDCLSGEFWAIWYNILGIDKALKPELKRAIYSCMYSLSDVSIPPAIGKNFIIKFFERYPTFYRYLTQVKERGLAIHRNYTWDGQELRYIPNEYHEDYKILNRPIQFGLANLVMCIAADLMKTMYVSAINFDSVWVCGIDNAEQLRTAVQSSLDKIGMNFIFDISEGSNLAEAQGK